mmetsp:Transcript_4024/g.4535  ORF Transcript_4024/g.4535 Transcript_4024/m.4535 type:complete len:318 (+) Transcript_4024:78-1031(+)
MSYNRKEPPNACRLPNDISKLDLHGYTKSEGICRTTEFLDRTSRKIRDDKTWVLIVTGSGSHSSHGPVLRGAIESLLKKRNIEFYPMNHGKGGFIVNAASGFALYEPEQPRDSKIIVAPSVSIGNDFYEGGNNNETDSIPVPVFKPMSLIQQRRGNGNGNKVLKKSFQEQCKEKTAYQRAMSESLAETRQIKKDDEELLDRAFNLSLLDKRRDIEMEEKLQQVIDDSRAETRIQSQEEDEQLRKVAELSRIEYTQHNMNNDPDACLLRAIQTSREESNKVDDEMLSILEQSIHEHQRYQEDDEELLLKVLEQSVAEF